MCVFVCVCAQGKGPCSPWMQPWFCGTCSKGHPSPRHAEPPFLLAVGPPCLQRCPPQKSLRRELRESLLLFCRLAKMFEEFGGLGEEEEEATGAPSTQTEGPHLAGRDPEWQSLGAGEWGWG